MRGKVYVTIPPHRSGQGQIEIMLQGRLITADAITDAGTALLPLSAVEVVSVQPDNLMIVQHIYTLAQL